MERRDVIFDVIEMIRSVEENTGLNSLDPISKEILGRIAAAEVRDKPAKVTEIIKLGQLGTPPTLFGRVSNLEENGWIVALIDDADKRVRRLTLTPKARRAYSMMSAAAFKIFDHH